MSTIYIRESDTYRTRVEDVTNRKLFFYPVYRQARDCLKGIVSDTRRYQETQRRLASENRGRAEIDALDIRGYPNNIIAFCADRGHGKTSAMISFSTALARMNSHDPASFCDADKFWDENTKRSRFLVLDPIDPTAMEKTDSIIRTILSRMFQIFTKKPFSAYSDQEKREAGNDLLLSFQTCFRLADLQKDSQRRNDDYDDLQALSDLGDSANFKGELNTLISRYLAFMFNSEQGSADHFLVIQIDDADMNTDNAYEVVEDLRKYCVLPNVIILFAADISLLEQTVEQYFVKSFLGIINADVSGDPVSEYTAQISRERCHRTAISYLEKFIPGLHRINLPGIDAELRNTTHTIYLNMELPDAQQGRRASSFSGEYQQALIELLRRKCLFSIPVSSSAELHPFLPKRMRELSHFVATIRSMEDINCTHHQLLAWRVRGQNGRMFRPAVKRLETNLELLQDYFLNRWCELRLNHREREAISHIHAAPTDKKVWAAIDALRRFFPEETELTNAHRDSGWSTLLSCIEHLESTQKRDFACAIRIYFHLFKDILMAYDYEEGGEQGE